MPYGGLASTIIALNLLDFPSSLKKSVQLVCNLEPKIWLSFFINML